MSHVAIQIRFYWGNFHTALFWIFGIFFNRFKQNSNCHLQMDASAIWSNCQTKIPFWKFGCWNLVVVEISYNFQVPSMKPGVVSSFLHPLSCWFIICRWRDAKIDWNWLSRFAVLSLFMVWCEMYCRESIRYAIFNTWRTIICYLDAFRDLYKLWGYLLCEPWQLCKHFCQQFSCSNA